MRRSILNVVTKELGILLSPVEEANRKDCQISAILAKKFINSAIWENFHVSSSALCQTLKD